MKELQEVESLRENEDPAWEINNYSKKHPDISGCFYTIEKYYCTVSSPRILNTRLVIVQAKKITTKPMMALIMIFFHASFPSSWSHDVMIFQPPQRAIPTIIRPRRVKRLLMKFWIVAIGLPASGHFKPSSTRSNPGSISHNTYCTDVILPTAV